MEIDRVLFWLAVCSCVPALLEAARAGVRSSLPLLLATALVLLTAGVADFAAPQRAGWIAITAWAIFIVAPRVSMRVFADRVGQQRFASAWRWSLLLSLIYPLGRWRGRIALLTALKVEERGNLAGARRQLRQLADDPALEPRIRLSSRCHLHRLAHDWEAIIAATAPHEVSAESGLQALRLRALGETGRLEDMLGLLRASRAQGGPPQPFGALIVLAFCGRPVSVARLLQGWLRHMQAEQRAFWRATAALAAGGDLAVSARADLHRRLIVGTAAAQLGALKRLDQPLADPASLLAHPNDRGLLERLEAELAATPGAVPQRLRQAASTSTVTAALILANLVMFGVELAAGGSENDDTLYRLGALWPQAVWDKGEWWRLVTPLFLHAGWLHIGLNMLALAILGTRVERRMGHWRTLLVYLGSGIGSTAGVLFLMLYRHGDDDLLVGASGAIFGLFGGQLALLLRDWRHHRSAATSRGLQEVALVVLLQAAFDLSTPEVSFSGHVGGLLVGTLITAGLLHPGLNIRSRSGERLAGSLRVARRFLSQRPRDPGRPGPA